MCESVWNGGAGYTPDQVAELTPDQIYFRLCSMDMLKEQRTKSVPADSIAELVDENGMIKGRAEDGTEIKAKYGGKSLLQQIKEGKRGNRTR